METWFLILISISFSLLLKSIISTLLSSSTYKSSSPTLPPGPFTFPIIGNFLWLRRTVTEIEPILHSLYARFGPMVTLRIGTRHAIFVADRELAYQALVQNGAVFADRPPPLPTGKIMGSNQHNVSSAGYGPTWRLLRRNLTAEILHPSRVKTYAHARRWVLTTLLERIGSEGHESCRGFRVVDHFQYAMFCLLVLMCFGDKLSQEQIKEIEHVQRQQLLSFTKFNTLNFWPRVTKFLLRRRWEEFLQVRRDQEAVLIPLIRARKKIKEEKLETVNKEHVLSYVDTLIDLELPEEGKRKLEEGELVSLCSEFLNAGVDTTSTALQWIMANLVKYPHIQERLLMEMKGVVREGEEEVKEEDLQRMPYLKAIILEGLRRHSPGHFLLPHRVTDDILLGGFLVPKNGTVNFAVAEMSWDPKVWDDPMAFKPERFLNSDDKLQSFDITGSREIKMMPFGAGRRICPGLNLAMLHLEYFVANLIWKFQWNAVDQVDLSEKQEFTTVMKNPLQARISPRINNINN